MKNTKYDGNVKVNLADISKERRMDLAIILKELKEIQDNELAAIAGVTRNTLHLKHKARKAKYE